MPNPTGHNGYEEYLQAADISATPGFDLFYSYNPNNLDPEERGVLPQGVTPQDSFLMVQRKFVARFERCLFLIKQGNQKPIESPQTKLDALVPGLSSFRRLAKLESSAAEIEFADGQNSTAIGSLEDGLTFADRIGSGPMISRLVGIALTSILLRELDRHWQQLSEPDAEELSRFLSNSLAHSSLAQSFVDEEESIRSGLNTLRTDPSQMKVTDDETGEAAEPDLNRLWSRTTPEQQSIALDQAFAQLHTSIQAIVQGLNGPEEEWLKLANRVDAENNVTPTSLSAMLSLSVMPSMSSGVVAEERERTRLRIAALTLRAIRYRWETGKLPTKMEEFSSAMERKDPSNGLEFAYRREGDWFRIVHTGTDALGDVRLGPSPQKTVSVRTQP